jgi:glycosyltransferase involved in cell wall biosynthesis
MNKFRPMDKNKIRRKLNLPLDKKIILFVGYLWPIKGLNYLVDAIPDIVEKQPDSLFLFIGRGHLRNKMIKKCRKYSIEKNVRFLGGKEHDEIPIWLNASDMLILPSLSEGRPNVVLEAMACETPVIATRVGGTPELVENGFNGILVEPKDPKEIENAALTLLADEDLREKMGKNGRKKILRDGLTWEKHAEKTIEVYGRC